MTEIVEAIQTHIGTDAPSNWYVGITGNVRERLFGAHQVDEANGSWIYREASSSQEARAIERHFLDRVGTKGGPGGGDATTKTVYAYRITSATAE